MYVNERLVSDLIQSISDTVAGEPDSLARLAMLQTMNEEWQRLMLTARDEAAYESRKRYSNA
jgi:hypothetical protein